MLRFIHWLPVAITEESELMENFLGDCRKDLLFRKNLLYLTLPFNLNVIAATILLLFVKFIHKASVKTVILKLWEAAQTLVTKCAKLVFFSVID